MIWSTVRSALKHASPVQMHAGEWLHKKTPKPSASLSSSDAEGYLSENARFSPVLVSIKMQRLFHMKQFVGIPYAFSCE